jgi:2-isopropylmalate synthase
MQGGGRGEATKVEVDLLEHGRPVTRRGDGNGPIDAFTHALGHDIRVMDYHEHAIGSGANAQAASYIELRLNNGATRFGVGIDANIVTASFRAIVSGLNRQIAAGERTEPEPEMGRSSKAA